MQDIGYYPFQDLLSNQSLIVPDPAKGQYQPGSVDLRFGAKAWCVSTSFVPNGKESVEELAKKFLLHPEFELREDVSNTLMYGNTYIVELLEQLQLKPIEFAASNPKSSTGRADELTFILADGIPKKDYFTDDSSQLRKLYIEFTPQTWHTGVRKGTAVSQIRLGRGNPMLNEKALYMLHTLSPILFDRHGTPVAKEDINLVDGGVELTLDLQSDIVAYRAKKGSHLIYELAAQRGELASRANEFWEPIERPASGELTLEKDSFYLLATNERVAFPPPVCGTLNMHHVQAFHGVTHYAGFFDIGFGMGSRDDKYANSARGTAGTLEVRVFGTPVRFRHGQKIAVMRYELMRDMPRDADGNSLLYGQGQFGTNYFLQSAGPTLPKQFLTVKAERR